MYLIELLNMVNIIRITMYWYVLLISLGQYMVSFVAVNVLFHWNTVSWNI